jgi:hypothetical protein
MRGQQRTGAERVLQRSQEEGVEQSELTRRRRPHHPGQLGLGRAQHPSDSAEPRQEPVRGADGVRTGLQATVKDQGQGIALVETAHAEGGEAAVQVL